MKLTSIKVTLVLFLFGALSLASVKAQNLTVNGVLTVTDRANVGYGNYLPAPYALAVGTGCYAGDPSYGRAIAMGVSCSATAQGSIALGMGSSASTQASISLGYYNTASGVQAFATGSGTVASGEVSFTTGYSNTASGKYSAAIGNTLTASSYNQAVFGRFNTTPTVNATSWVSTDPLCVVGNGSSTSLRSNALTILKDGSISAGAASVGTGVTSFASGNGTQATSFVQTVFGQYNALPSTPNATTWVAADPLFVVGNGTTTTARSNAMTILKNGAVLIKPSGDLSMGTYTAGTQP